MDILKRLHNRELSFEDATQTFSDVIEEIHAGGSDPSWAKTLGLSQYEATALMQGATFQTLVKLRYEGWPKLCSRCSLPLDYKLFGWWLECSGDAIPRLRHIQCPVSDI